MNPVRKSLAVALLAGGSIAGGFAGSVLVRDINPGTAGSTPLDFGSGGIGVRFGDALYFLADDGTAFTIDTMAASRNAAGHPVVNDFWNGTATEREHWSAACHRFEERVVGGRFDEREEERVARSVQLAQPFVDDGPRRAAGKRTGKDALLYLWLTSVTLDASSGNYVGSFFDPDLDEGCAFEELISFHGGMGGNQTRPFLLFPAGFELPDEPIVGAATGGVVRASHDDGDAASLRAEKEAQHLSVDDGAPEPKPIPGQ